MKLLAIETSCDETAAAIIGYDGATVSVLSSIVSSQADLHAKWGGVIPNLAAREHVQNIIPVVESALREAAITPTDIDVIAVTEGPGLIPALLIGVSAAKTLALTWAKPLIGVNHLEGHIYANFLNSPNDKLRMTNSESISENRNLQTQSKFEIQHSKFPLLALIVSGGHTQLVLMHDHFQYQLLGETDDDAAGEAFDKVAKMLNLPYPGGPEIGKRADEFRIVNSDSSSNDELRVTNDRLKNSHIQSKFKNRNSTFIFPRPMLDSNNYHFSFSGLKTAVLYFLKKHEGEIKNEKFVDMVCHEFQEAVVDTLVGKTERALQEFQPKTVIIAGGVSANVRLRERMKTMVAQYPDYQFLMPPFQYSLDNAAMIGAAGILRYARMSEAERATLKVNALSLEPSAHLPLQ